MVKEFHNGKGITIIARGLKRSGHIILRIKPKYYQKITADSGDYSAFLTKLNRHLKRNEVIHDKVRMHYVRVEVEDHIKPEKIVKK